MIDQIRAKIQADQFEISQHAVDNSILRHVTLQEVREAFAQGQIIEDCPDDKYGPSCLVLGFTRNGRPLHIQCSHPSRPVLKIIALYQPDPDKWIEFKRRKNQS